MSFRRTILIPVRRVNDEGETLLDGVSKSVNDGRRLSEKTHVSKCREDKAVLRAAPGVASAGFSQSAIAVLDWRNGTISFISVNNTDSTFMRPLRRYGEQLPSVKLPCVVSDLKSLSEST